MECPASKPEPSPAEQGGWEREMSDMMRFLTVSSNAIFFLLAILLIWSAFHRPQYNVERRRQRIRRLIMRVKRGQRRERPSPVRRFKSFTEQNEATGTTTPNTTNENKQQNETESSQEEVVNRRPRTFGKIVKNIWNGFHTVASQVYPEEYVDEPTTDGDSEDNESVLGGFRTPELIRSHSVEKEDEDEEEEGKGEEKKVEEEEKAKSEETEKEDDGVGIENQLGEELEDGEEEDEEDEEVEDSDEEDEDEVEDEEEEENEEERARERQKEQEMLDKHLKEAFLVSSPFRLQEDDTRDVPPPAPPMLLKKNDSGPGPLSECPNNICKCTCGASKKKNISSTKLTTSEELKFDEFLLSEGFIRESEFGRNVLVTLD